MPPPTSALRRWPPPWTAATMARSARVRFGHGRRVDLLVVGAGVTGAAVAREAALRGLSVVVCERRDVGFGASSRSSRLVHGGVRYLEQGDLGLVRQALAERQVLIAVSGGLVTLDRFLLPAYRDDRRSYGQVRLGLALYDVLSGFAGRSRGLAAAAAVARLPLLDPTGLRGAVAYDDARTDDARLTLAVLQDARRRGAEVFTYTPVSQLASEDGAVTATTPRGSIRARACVVAAGPYTGPKLLGEAGRALVVPSKGIHLVFRREDVPLSTPLVLQVPRRKRIVFVLPWGPRTYVGTTDTPYEGPLDDVGVTARDVAELLAVVRPRLPRARLEPDRIVGAYAGVRPLVRRAGAAADVADLSRSHRVVEGAPGVFAIVGGKLTTHRVMAEDVLARVSRRLGMPFRRGLSKRVPLVPAEPRGRAPDCAIAAELRPRHGDLAPDLAARARAVPDLSRPVVPGLPYLWVEVEHALAYEGCVHLDDLLRRRLPLALVDARASVKVAPVLARRLLVSAGRPPAEAEAEVARYVEKLRRESGAAVPDLASSARANAKADSPTVWPSGSRT